MILLATMSVLAAAPVIFVTVDGVSRSDAADPHVFARLKKVVGSQVLETEAATPALLSLPAYQSIFEGRLTDCADNGCRAVSQPTWVDTVAGFVGTPQKNIGVFASWEKFSRAVSTDVSGIYSVIGPQAADGASAEWGGARLDAFTWADAMNFLKNHHPRLLVISLNDADEWAHLGNRERYLETLAQYDRWLSDLASREKAATLIITTDHGRGPGSQWTEHGAEYPTAKLIWWLHRGLPPKTALPSHLQLRPIIERLFKN